MLQESDTRAMVRILGEVAASDGSVQFKRNLLMNGLCQLVDVDSWYWCMLGRVEPGKQPSFAVNLKGGFSEEQFADYLKAQEHPDMKNLNAPFLSELEKEKSHVTRLRQQIDVEGNFPKSDVYEMWRKADLAPLILSFRPISGGQISGIALFRRFDRKLFTERDSKIVHILLSEVPWLHDGAWPGLQREKTYELPPRLNTLLNLLLEGSSRKQIAAQMGITVNTLSGYVKDLYERFQVHSQTELIRRFVEGDGGDTP